MHGRKGGLVRDSIADSESFRPALTRVAGFDRNGWPTSVGIGGRIASESLAALRRITQLGKEPATQVVKNIRRATRRHFSAEDKIRIVLEGLRGEDSIAEFCRREGIVQNLYYRWSKDFLEAGKKRLAGDTARGGTPVRNKCPQRMSV